MMRGLRKFLARLAGGRGAGRQRETFPSAPDDTDFRLLTESSGDIICRIDADNLPVYVSPSVKHVLGWTPEEMIAAGTRFIHPDDQALVRSVNDRLITGEIEATTVTIRMMTKAGAPVWVEASARSIRDADGTPSVVIVMRDISERKQVEDQLRIQALTDGLTGLANRRSFDDALEQAWQRTLRAGGEMSLLMLDVDMFKSFNDLYGHQAGDDCLRVLTSAIRDVARPTGGMVARYGGEEIAVILPDTGAVRAHAIAEAARTAIEALRLHHAGNEAGVVTASIGVATAFARDGARMQMPAGLLLAADSALYKAKQSGRNRVVATVILTGCGAAG
jgi:diguanylate cyclase (GGDEF)-like protein/PAS domain S-box-containing protein